MTLPDLGPERPGPASDTRELVQRRHTEPGTSLQIMSGKTFWIALVVVAAAIALFALLLK